MKAYEQGAIRGDPESEYMLGILSQQGMGVPVDLARAIEWFRRAAEHGHGGAELLLGAFYQTGEGVQEDPGEAARWYERAAKRGRADAQFNLGSLYRDGEGVSVDGVQALKWFLLAAQGTPRAKQADIEIERLVRQMPLEQVSLARQLAAEFQPIVAAPLSEQRGASVQP